MTTMKEWSYEIKRDYYSDFVVFQFGRSDHFVPNAKISKIEQTRRKWIENFHSFFHLLIQIK